MIAISFLLIFGAMIAEAVLASRNERAQRARGGLEPSGDVYPAMQIVYPGAFLAMFAEGSPPSRRVRRRSSPSRGWRSSPQQRR